MGGGGIEKRAPNRTLNQHLKDGGERGTNNKVLDIALSKKEEK